MLTAIWLVLKKGGGILVAVERWLRCVRRIANICRKTQREIQREYVWLDVPVLEGKKLLIGEFYVLPDSRLPVFNSVLSSIEEAPALKSNHKLLVLGGFNTQGVELEN